MSGGGRTRDGVVLVTGGSAGIGERLALRLAGPGARLALAARGAERLEEVAAACRARGAEAAAFPTDVTDPEACRRLVDAALARFGRLDTLIANAGVSMWARLDEVTDLGIFERLMAVNYLGAVYCTHAALPALKASRGRLVAVASLVALTGVPVRSGYAAAKHAVRGFFDSLRIELEGTGVAVTVVYPGFVATGGRERGFGPDGAPLGTSPAQESRAMSADECARQILAAADRRRRELVMTARGRVARWIKMFAPGLVDKIARRAIERGI
jgi:short-subunit dehydrogenase